MPVRIDGVEFTPFSRLAGKVRRRLFPRIHVRILPPRRLTAPEGVTGRARRVALRRALGDEMVQSMFAAARIDTTLFDALLDAASPARRQPRGRRRPRAAAHELSRPRHGQLRAGRRRWRGGRARASASACCCRRRAPRSSPSSRCRPSSACRRCSTSRPAPPSAIAACRGAEISAHRHGAHVHREGEAPGARRRRSSRMPRSSTSRTSSARSASGRSSSR